MALHFAPGVGVKPWRDVPFSEVVAFFNGLKFNQKRHEHTHAATTPADELVLLLSRSRHGPGNGVVRRVLTDGIGDNTMQGGYVIVQGALMGFHCIRPGAGPWLMQHAINDGATYMEVLASGPMPELAGQYGWVVVDRLPNHDHPDLPDVLVFKRDAH